MAANIITRRVALALVLAARTVGAYTFGTTTGAEGWVEALAGVRIKAGSGGAAAAGIPWRRVAATPRLRRGYSVKTSRGRRRGCDADTQWRRAHHTAGPQFLPVPARRRPRRVGLRPRVESSKLGELNGGERQHEPQRQLRDDAVVGREPRDGRGLVYLQHVLRPLQPGLRRLELVQRVIFAARMFL